MTTTTLLSEQPIPFSEVPSLLPRRNGKKVHYMTVHRWAKRGARGRVLESTLIGGVRYTSLAALNRFFGCDAQDPGDLRREDVIHRLAQQKPAA